MLLALKERFHKLLGSAIPAAVYHRHFTRLCGNQFLFETGIEAPINAGVDTALNARIETDNDTGTSCFCRLRGTVQHFQ